MTNVDPDRKVRDILSDAEFELMLAEARVNDSKFLASRNPAILCTARLTGKRRGEIAGLRRFDVNVSDKLLLMNFGLLKKHKEKPPQVVKRIKLDNPYTKPIVEYVAYLDQRHPDAGALWPSVRNVFGNYKVYPDKGLCGKQIYNVIREIGDSVGVNVWPHLFRETAGGEEIIKDPSQYGVAGVMSRIDVTERTAWAYMARHVGSVIETRKIT